MDTWSDVSEKSSASILNVMEFYKVDGETIQN